MQADRAPSARPKDRLRTLGSLDGRTTGARTAQHLAAAFKRALGDRYSPAMKPLIESAAMAAAIAADLQARSCLAGDASVSVNDVVSRGQHCPAFAPRSRSPGPAGKAEAEEACRRRRRNPRRQAPRQAARTLVHAASRSWRQPSIRKASPTGTVRVAEGMPPRKPLVSMRRGAGAAGPCRAGALPGPSWHCWACSPDRDRRRAAALVRARGVPRADGRSRARAARHGRHVPVRRRPAVRQVEGDGSPDDLSRVSVRLVGRVLSGGERALALAPRRRRRTWRK